MKYFGTHQWLIFEWNSLTTCTVDGCEGNEMCKNLVHVEPLVSFSIRPSYGLKTKQNFISFNTTGCMATHSHPQADQPQANISIPDCSYILPLCF